MKSVHPVLQNIEIRRTHIHRAKVIQLVHDLPALFIVSQVCLKLDEGWGSDEFKEPGKAKGILIKVEKAEGEKCERCWNYLPTVGAHAEHPTLCHRCVEAVS